MQFMSRSPLASQVSGVILEAPALDWNATLAYRSRVLGVPPVATWLGKFLAAMRAHLDWNQLDRVAHHEGVGAPLLVFHGVHDQFVPVGASEAYARALPGQVTLVRIEGGNHVEAWNADPAHYATTVNQWCTAHSIGSDPR